MAGAYFEIQESHQDHRLQLALLGELDLKGASVLKTRLERLPGDKRQVLLDLSSLEFIDSSGLNALIEMVRRLRESGRSLEVGAELAPEVRRVLELTRVDRFIVDHGTWR
jgi:anti-anti-sigma factor